MGAVKAQVRYDPSVDAIQPQADLRAQRAALEAEVAELRATLARLEQRLARDEPRSSRASSYFWGVLFGFIALMGALGFLYYGFMNVMSLD
jgi:hypothetical protein